MNTSPFYQLIATNEYIEMSELQSLATQIKGGNSLSWSGSYPQESYNNINFCWVGKSCSVFFEITKKPAVILLSVPNAIFNKETVNKRLENAMVTGSSGKPVSFNVNVNFPNALVVEFELAVGESSLTIVFSDYFQEDSGGRSLSLAAQSIIKLNKEHYQQMNEQELAFTLATGVVPAQNTKSNPDKVADYFIQLIGGSE